MAFCDWTLDLSLAIAGRISFFSHGSVYIYIYICFGKIPVACCVLLVTRCGSVCVLARFSVYQLSLLPVACCVLLVTRCGSACSLTIVLEVGMVPCMQPHFRPGT